MYLTLRRHWHLFLATILVVVGLIVYLGDIRVIAYTVSSDWHEQDVQDSYTTANAFGLLNQPDLYSMEFIHTIEIDIDQDDLDLMLLTYLETGEKEYFSTNITIDGYTITNAGLRLKGNSSLRSATESSEAPINEGMETSMPYLVKLDEYINDQNYQGYTEISLRSNFHDQAYLREIMAYELLKALGITTPNAVYGGVNFNGEGEVLYTVVEHINEEFVTMNFDDTGLGNLIKASVGGGFNYMGDDPTAYLNTFELKTNENVSDLHDLIEFLQFIQESSDEEFAEGIEDYLNLEQMLRYLVFCNATVTMDSFPGNSNNYFLYQDSESQQFTLIPWDFNGAYGGFWNFGNSPPALMDIFFEREDFVNFPQKPNRPQRPLNPNRELPGLMKTMPDQDLKKFAVDRPPESGNPLVARLLENDEISKMYMEIYEEFAEEVFNKKESFERMNQLSRMVIKENETRDFLMSGLEVYAANMQALKDFIDQRIEFLDQELYNAGT